MGFFELLLTSIGLAMDAFAVSICKGLKMKRVNKAHALIIGLFFGGFQALMPLIGYFLGAQFESYIARFDHWVAFLLLAFIGGKMMKDSFSKEPNGMDFVDALDYKELLILAIATSIDALAVGIMFGILKVSILPAISLIGGITLALSFIGVFVGNCFGVKYKRRAELAGGILLILIGLKILLEHLEVLSF